jgi:hypothetical protein
MKFLNISFEVSLRTLILNIDEHLDAEGTVRQQKGRVILHD